MGPDGDALLEDELWQQFRLVDCENCHGALKPAVVFFGEAVPSGTVSARVCGVVAIELPMRCWWRALR